MALNTMSPTNNSEHPVRVLRIAVRRRLTWLSALGLCGMCSCTSMARQPAVDPFHADPQPAVSRAQPPAPGRARLPSTAAPAAPQFANRAVAPRSAMSGLTASRPIASRPDSQSAIQLASNQTPAPATSDRAVERVAAESRTPVNCPDPYAVGPADDGGASPSAYPDEYLFDGGDRDYPITRDLDQFRGLDTEDTIAQFEDEDGRKKIKKTNRVAIYAPRFGSVVTVTGPNSETLVDKVHGHVVAQGGVNLRNRTVVSSKDQKLATGRMDTRLSPSGVGTEISTDSLNRDQIRGVDVAVLNTHESKRRLGIEQFGDGLKPHQLEGMQFAEIWTRKQNPVIQGLAISSTQSVTVQVQADFTGLEDKGKRGDLRLHKTADKGAAAIGDIITFTIHYENAGDRELKNVVLIDNLTPRLEYLPEGTSTSLPGKVEVSDNGEGSVVLQFVLDKPLPGRTKGSITFQARVR